MNVGKSLKKWKNKFSNSPKVLVTGGLGYIGSHTVVELIDTGFEVYIVDNLCNSTLEVLGGIEKITGVRPVFENIDCTDYMALDKFFRKHEGINAIIHFAALKAVGESVEKPLAYYRNNILSMVNILDIMKKYTVPNLVFSSSCTVYGQPDNLPVDETAPFKEATSPYGNTKQMCENIIKDTIYADKELSGVILRYFNPIGAHPSALIGELPIGVPNNLLPYIAQTAAGLRKKLSVYGNDYPTPDGSCIRDYIHVLDLACAHAAALKRLLEKKVDGTEAYNIGTGKGYSVLEILDLFQEINDVKVPYDIVARRDGDIEQVWADPKLANKKLEWKAVESIESALKSVWKWQVALSKEQEDDTTTKSKKMKLTSGS